MCAASMVSEPFVSSAESVMTNESDDEVFVLKFAPRLGFQLSNLKDIIDEHFNLPHVQVRCGKNGGVVLTGLFDGIPDDVESQDHESFDEINKLLGWIEGCIELPERSKSVAPKLFDENLKAMEESSDQHVHDEFEVTLANSDQISHKEVPLDEIPTCDVTNDDDMLIDEGLNVDNAVKGDEEIVQIELNDELILMKEFSDLVAHQVFDEMPRVMASHEINFDGPKLSGVASLGAVVNQPNRLHSKFDHDKVYPKLHKSVLETYVNSVACLELHYFDPGGKGFRLSGSLISNESELVDELVDDEYDHKAMHVGSVSDQDDLKVFDMNDVKDAKPLLLAKSELTGLFKKPNKLTTQGRMMNGPVESLIFDPGGQLLLLVVSRFLADMGEVYLCAHVVCNDFIESILSWQLMLVHHFREAAMLHNRGSYVLKLFEQIPSSKESMASLIELKGRAWNASSASKTESKFFYLGADWHGARTLVFDPGGYLAEDWLSSHYNLECCYCLNLFGRINEIFEVLLLQVIEGSAIGELLESFGMKGKLLSGLLGDKILAMQKYSRQYKSNGDIFIFDLGGEGARFDDHVIYLSVTDEFAYMSEVALSRGKWLMQTEVERGFLIWIVLPCFILLARTSRWSMTKSLVLKMKLLVIYQRVLELGKRKVNVNLQDRLIGDASMVIKLEEFAEMKTHSLLLEVAEELVVFGKKFLKSYVAIGLHILISQDQVEITHKRIVSTVVRLLIGWTAREVIASSLTCPLEARSLVWLRTTSTTDLHHYISCRILIFYEIVTDDP